MDMNTVTEGEISDQDNNHNCDDDHNVQQADPARDAQSTVASTYFDEKIPIPDAESVSSCHKIHYTLTIS